MSAFREFLLDDLYKFTHLLFDPMVEVYTLSFYLQRLLEYPQLSETALSPNNRISGYIFGARANDKEAKLFPSNAHISSLAIDHKYRRLGLATKLLEHFHQASELKSDSFVDLFVRETNKSAINLYESFGYVKYRWLPKFYNNKEHGYEMRLPLSSDVAKKSLEGRRIQKACNFGHKLLHLFLLCLIGLGVFLLSSNLGLYN